jgi:hypothetical protein
MHHLFGIKHGTKEIMDSSNKPGIAAFAVMPQMGEGMI